MKPKTLTIQLNDEQLPILPVEPEAHLSFTTHADGNEFAGMDSTSIWMTCIASTPREKAS